MTPTLASSTPLHPHPITTPDAWADALANWPDAHALQSWAWGDFKSRWGWSAERLLWRDAEGTAVAATQILTRQLPYLPTPILYIPRGPVLDYANEGVRGQMLAALQQLAREKRAILVKIDPDVVVGTGVDEVEPHPPGIAFRDELRAAGWRFSDEQIQFRNTVTLDLAKSEEELLAAMKQKTRYNIRLAGRKGVTVREGVPADFPAIATLYAETAARDAFTIRPIPYYLDAWQTLYDAGHAVSLLAEYEGQLLGAVIIVTHDRRAIYMYGASSDAERKRMPNYLLQWEAIRRARAAGCTLYDFWGAPDAFTKDDPLWGVWRFKAGFNGTVTHGLGAWDYAPSPLLYRLYTAVLPRYIEWLRGRRPTA